MTARRPYYSCACFYTQNIYIDQYPMHVSFTDPQQFRRDYERVLHRRGCKTPEQFANVLEKVEKEVDRRMKLGAESLQRRAAISRNYKPLHPEVFVLQESFLAAEFLEAVRFCGLPEASLESLLNRVHSIPGKRIHRLPIFLPEFCRALVEELENFERSDVPKGRPNTMNNYGVLLNELGFDELFLTPLREKYLQPLASLLFPDWGGGRLDSHRAFVVKYALHEDLDLGGHYDNAEVPANERRYTEVEHVFGQGILHRGQQVHGALPITSGERWNLIIWMRASSLRNKLCPMCDREPRLVETLGEGDGFSEAGGEGRAETVNVCAVI
ncbi:hypothetical protein FKM82_005061 [Ascaphus truei]